MPHTTTTSGATPASLWATQYEDMITPRPMVISSDMAEEIENITSAPGAVYPIPEGAISSYGESVEIPNMRDMMVESQQTDEFIWTTESGDRVPISKLEDDHLANIIKMLSRNMIGLDEKSRQYQRNESTLILMRAERDKRNAQP